MKSTVMNNDQLSLVMLPVALEIQEKFTVNLTNKNNN